MTELAAILGALASGGLGKYFGNSKATGPLPWGKVLGPLAAALGAIAITAALGVDLDTQTIFQQGGESGATAIVIHTVLKNLIQLLRSFRGPQT